MSLPHAASGEVIAVVTPTAVSEAKSATLVKTRNLEVLRLVLPKGKEIPSHKAPGEITVQCIEGRVVFTCHGKSPELLPGDCRARSRFGMIDARVFTKLQNVARSLK